MKKYMLMVLVMSFVMTFAGVSVAAESENVASDDLLMAEAAEARVIGEDIKNSEGEMKIVSLPVDEGEGGGSDAMAPDEILQLEQERIDAANEGAVDSDHTGTMTPDELSEQELQELADLAAQSGVVGDGIEISDDMAKIVSVEEEEAPFNWPLAAGIAGGVVVLGGVIFLLIKRSKTVVTAT